MLLNEATHDGSLLNFVGKVSTVRDVADVFEKVQRKRRLEYYLPYSDSLLVRSLECFPWDRAAPARPRQRPRAARTRPISQAQGHRSERMLAATRPATGSESCRGGDFRP
jgi:hypothetical protein